MQPRYKYPRTFHLPWSECVHGDDKLIDTLAAFEGQDVVVMEKMDGENTSLYSDGMHARSIDSPGNFTRSWCQRLQATLAPDIPAGYVFNGENVGWRHSIHYQHLEGFFYLFAIWDDQGYRLSFDELNEWAQVLDIPLPRVLYRGVFDEKVLRQLARGITQHNERHARGEVTEADRMEGYVVSLTRRIHREDFAQSTAKFVIKDHLQPNKGGQVEHWLKHTAPNALRAGAAIRPAWMS